MNLYEEKLEHKEHRHVFVKQKLLFIIGLFGLGVLEIKGGDESAILFNTGFLLYLVPFVALAYDVYIFAEDFKVKRIGLFVRTNKMVVCDDEKFWEGWVSSHREGLAEKASKSLTLIAFLSSAALIIMLRATHPFGKDSDNIHITSIIGFLNEWRYHFFYILWFLLSFYCIIRAGRIYKESRRVLNQSLKDLSPLVLTEELSTALRAMRSSSDPKNNQKDVQSVTELLRNEFREKLLRVPSKECVEIVKKEKPELQWVIYEKKQWWWWLWLIKPGRKLYIISEDDKDKQLLVVEQIY